MIRRFGIALFVVAIVLQSFSFANPTYKVVLKNDEVLVLEMVEDPNADVSSDLPLGLEAFEGAFRDATDEELRTHFGPDRDVRGYYRNLLNDDDVVPFHDGELLWIRAYLNGRLVGWMTLVPNLRGAQTVYVSTLVIDPHYHQLGIGREMLASIRAHWVPLAQELDLIVRRINYEALPFYDRLGFIHAPDLEAAVVDEPSRCMAMRLIGPRFYNLAPRVSLNPPLMEDINTRVVADVFSRGFDSF